jgi:hypothetical protein
MVIVKNLKPAFATEKYNYGQTDFKQTGILGC